MSFIDGIMETLKSQLDSIWDVASDELKGLGEI
jgi:hypothetical protein